MAIGPVQLLVIGFAGAEFTGKIREEIHRLEEGDTIRLIDVLAVRKDEDGNVERLHQSDLSPEEAAEFGATVGALIGLGAAGLEGAEAGAEIGALKAVEEGGQVLPEGAWYVDDVLPPGTAAAVALIEHRWAIGLRDSILEAGGFTLAESWVHPLDLVAIGVMAAEEAEQIAT
jgi:uncharacterized membrane protein